MGYIWLNPGCCGDGGLGTTTTGGSRGRPLGGAEEQRWTLEGAEELTGELELLESENKSEFIC